MPRHMNIDPILVNRLKTLSAKKVLRKLKDYLVSISYVAIFPVAYVLAAIYAKLTKTEYKFGILHFSSIGHALNVDALARRIQHKNFSGKFIIVSAYQKIINPYFYELIERKFTVVRNPFVGFFLMALVKVPNTFNGTGWLRYLDTTELAQYSASSWFNDADHFRGRELLASLGMGRDAWFVCFFARDNAYNESFNSGDERSYNLTYHSIRNSDIETYELAMSFVLSKGGFVIRMGMVATKPVTLKAPRLIDYPFGSFKSDFADVYLMCHAKFVVGCPSGIVDLSSITNVPLGAVNSWIPWLGHQRRNVIFVPKLFRYTESKIYLTLSEHQKLFSSASNSITFKAIIKRHGLCLVDNSEDEILLVVQRMYEYFVETQKGFALSMGLDNKIMPEFLLRYPALTEAASNDKH